MIKTRMTKLVKSLPATGIALMAVFLLASCKQDDALPGDNDGSMPALTVTTLQATDIDVSKAATRAVSTTDYPTANSIGFFVKANATNSYVACNNRKGEYSTARKLWLPTPDSIWLNSHDADIAVYAPYDAAHTTAATLNLASCLRPADGSKDIWCKHITANNKSKNLAVTLKHVYSRLALTVMRDANYKADASLTALDVKGDEIYESATYKPFETTPYTYSTTTGLTPTVVEQTLNSSTASATYDLLLIPTPLKGDITLTLTVDGKKMETIIDKTRFTGSKLDAGKQYNVDLTLKPGKLEIASVSLVKWDALPEINGGQAEFDDFSGIDIGLPFVIAPGNLIATQYVGDGGGYEYAFADEQGYYSGEGLGGDYFNWNTLSSTDYSVNQTGEWNNALDPCRQMSKGPWRTPTKDELQALINKGSKWGTYTMKNGATVNGRYFGTTSVPGAAEQNKYPFLPYTIYRSSGGSGIDASGTYADYWSSTPNGSSNAYCLNFNSSNCAINNFSRNYGFSIRCVKDKPKSKPAHAIEVEGLDFYVADGNVVATSDGAGGYTYQFADEQGYYSGDYANGGDYFCWNTLDPAATKSTNATLVWNDADDVCRKIGDGAWYTPTNDQLQKLVDLYDNNKNRWGTYTMKSGTGKVAGMYCATASVPDEANQDKYVFLPAAGNRYDNGSGTITDKGTGGFYWSNTPYGNNYAREVYFFDSEVYHGTDDFGRYFGFSVRCVRDK